MARQQFVIAQRCGAGLLLDFFRQVKAIEEPEFFFKKTREGKVEIWKCRLRETKAEFVCQDGEVNEEVIWPTKSPDGKSCLSYGYGVEVTARDKRLCVGVKSPQGTEVGWVHYFAWGGWSSVPAEMGRAFYINNYFIAITDAAEGDDWRHLYLLPAVPIPDINYIPPTGDVIYPFDSSNNEYWKHHIERVALP